MLVVARTLKKIIRIAEKINLQSNINYLVECDRNSKV